MNIDFEKLVCSTRYQNKIKKRSTDFHKRNALWTEYLSKSLYVHDLEAHLPIHMEKLSTNSPEWSLNADDAINDGTFDQSVWQFYGNMLRLPIHGPDYKSPKSDQDTKFIFAPKFQEPSKRPAIGYCWVFTLEHDPDDASGFQEQLDWLWKKSETGPSPIVLFDIYLRQNYRDYRGYNATWTGNKSIHYSFVFDCTWIDQQALESWATLNGTDPKHNLDHHYHGDINPDVIWEYYKSKWSDLVTLFTTETDVDVIFDTQLQTLAQKRRLPWGTRIELKDDNIHGFPIGTRIPQVVLEERILTTAPKGAEQYFLSAQEANNLVLPKRVRAKHSIIANIPNAIASDLLDELTKYLAKEWGQEYPKPSHFDDTYGVYFYNNANDTNPNTYLGPDYSHLVFKGIGAPTEKSLSHLPNYVCLSDLLYTLTDYLDDQKRDQIEVITTANRKRPKRTELATNLLDQWFEFRARNKDRSEIRDVMQSTSRLALESSPYACMVSPEGIGKSHQVLAGAIDYRMDDLTNWFFTGHSLTKQGRGFQLFASASYDQAEEQYDSYLNAAGTNNHNGNVVRPRHAVFLQSFSQLYKECSVSKVRGRKKISYSGALKDGYGSLMDAVYDKQRDVYDEITKLKNDAWKIAPVTGTALTNGKPNDSGFHQNFATILFTSHETAQTFNRPSKSKAWLHPDFDYATHADDPKQYFELAKQFQTYRIIHDEIAIDDLVWSHSPAEVQFANDVKHAGNKGWSEMSMPEKYAAFDNLADQAPDEMGFDKTLKVIEANFGVDDQVVVDFAALPFGTDNKKDGLYNGKHGTVIYMKPKTWWHQCKGRIVILTTERLPTRIIESFRWSNNNSDSDDVGFKLALWDRDYLYPTESLPMALSNQANSKGIQELADSLLDSDGDAFDEIISDVAEGDNITAHKTARGKNDLKEKNIATILTYLDPHRYCKFNVIAQVFDIPDAIILYYRDLLNQAVGRNQGFRRDDSNPKRHQLNLSAKLYHELGGRRFFQSGRYQFFLTKY
jgi:hypothetical protein